MGLDLYGFFIFYFFSTILDKTISESNVLEKMSTIPQNTLADNASSHFCVLFLSEHFQFYFYFFDISALKSL